MEDSMEIPLKTKNKTTNDPKIAPVGIYPEETKTEKKKNKKHMYPNVHGNTIYNSQDVEAT